MVKKSNELALKRQFLDRAKALSKLPEVFRCREVTQLICDGLAFGVRAEAEIFHAVYGNPGRRKYWDARLSEAIPVYSLAHILSVHLAESAEQLEMAKIATIRAFRDAAQAGERWFTGEIVFPAFGFAPRLYEWLVRQRFGQFYRRLRAVEHALQGKLTAAKAEALGAELDDIERSTRTVPLRHSDLYFMLRYHLDRTRSRLTEAIRDTTLAQASEAEGLARLNQRDFNT